MSHPAVRTRHLERFQIRHPVAHILQGGDSAVQIIESFLQMADQIADAEESGGMPPLSVATVALADAAIKWLRFRQPGR
jgi:hypothetical protein